MGKASLLQEKRDMLFEEGCGVWTERRLTQEEAAHLLGVCPRTFRRWADRHEKSGIEWLRERRLSGLRTVQCRWTRRCGWWTGTGRVDPFFVGAWVQTHHRKCLHGLPGLNPFFIRAWVQTWLLETTTGLVTES